MSKEFTIYTLFILLTISMGVVFQFLLARIKGIGETQKKIISSMGRMHRDMMDAKRKEPVRVTSRNVQKEKEVLKGDLTLEYRGAIADTRATFMLDNDGQ